MPRHKTRPEVGLKENPSLLPFLELCNSIVANKLPKNLQPKDRVIELRIGVPRKGTEDRGDEMLRDLMIAFNALTSSLTAVREEWQSSQELLDYLSQHKFDDCFSVATLPATQRCLDIQENAVSACLQELLEGDCLFTCFHMFSFLTNSKAQSIHSTHEMPCIQVLIGIHVQLCACNAMQTGMHVQLCAMQCKLNMLPFCLLLPPLTTDRLVTACLQLCVYPCFSRAFLIYQVSRKVSVALLLGRHAAVSLPIKARMHIGHNMPDHSCLPKNKQTKSSTLHF